MPAGDSDDGALLTYWPPGPLGLPPAPEVDEAVEAPADPDTHVVAEEAEGRARVGPLLFLVLLLVDLTGSDGGGRLSGLGSMGGE